ncbi:hypothetical protein ACJ72_00766 [Emergomyces africanus]|uniref:Parasitic phase-specific protein PSP-1 n=1 Tax=Emergomyces africanus TaxID=1955775 RepID=A0A1B7P756_9EURO|nr:hypothetical protein ACJ72_00766 [Emergomyces africanus]
MDPSLCTFEICDINKSYYGYRPSRPANIAFTVVFSVSFITYVLQSFTSRRFLGFSIVMVLGTLCEAIGYIGRVLMYDNPWDENRHNIGRENSRLPPAWYPRIFIPCDILALALQGAGGGLASSADPGTSGAELGTNLMIAGVVWQVVILLVFIVLAFDFAIRTLRRLKSIGAEALDPTHAKLRSSFAFRGFLIALSLATLFIFVRCAYRIAELSGGWDGPLMGDEPLFIGLEGVMIALAVVVLNGFHPGRGFGSVADISVVERKGQLSEDGNFS